MHVLDEQVHLRAGGTSVVVLLDGGRLPRILHWGDDLGEVSEAELAAIARAAAPAIHDSAVTYPQPVPVLAQLHEGWLGRPGLVGDSGGQRWAPEFLVSGSDLVTTDEAVRLTVEATDEAYGLGLVLELEVLHASGLVRQRARLRNARAEVFRVSGLELALPVPAAADELLDLTGRWSLERVPQRRAFDVGEWVRASRGGKPGLEHTL